MKIKLTLSLLMCLIVLGCKSESSSVEKMKNAAELNQKGASLIQNNPDEAMKLFREANKLDPTVPDYANNIGVVLLNQKKLDEAIVYFLKSTEIDPNYGRGYYNQGVSYQNLGNNEKAISAYHKALKLLPSPEIYYNLGIVYSRTGNKKSAIESYKKFIETAPPSYAQPIKDAKEKIKALGEE